MGLLPKAWGYIWPISQGAVSARTAQRWFRAAAEAGHGQAQMMLGRYLTRGLAGDIDLVEGRQWLERAVEQGITEAELDLGTVPAMPSPRRRARNT